MTDATSKQGKAPRRRGRKGKDKQSSTTSTSSPDDSMSVLSYKPHNTLLIHLTDETPTWYECGRGTACRDDTIFNVKNSKGKKSSKPRTNPPALVQKYRNLADSIYSQEVTIFKNNSSSKDEMWVENTMRKGTLKDRIAAMSVVVSSSPVHKLYALDMLLNLAGVSTDDNGSSGQTNERVENMAAEALSDLFSSTLLPTHRKLYGLESRPLYQYEEANEGSKTKKTISPRILLLWRYEEIMKSKYAAFLSQYIGKTLAQTSTSSESLTKINALRTACELLKAIPEGEQMLLNLVVNKIGDPTKKVACAAAHELRKILDAHPAMIATVAREVQQLAHRPNLCARALYNCIIFLNQLKLEKEENVDEGDEKSKKHVSLPASLINSYFQIFEFAVNKSKPIGKVSGKSKAKAELDQAMKSRLLGALLTGVNRAHPYLPSNDTRMDKHIDSLYRIAHVAPPSACTQAFMLLFHLAVGSGSDDNVAKNDEDIAMEKKRQDRFYRALYAKIADPTMLYGKQLTLYFNLIYKAMKYDTDSNRIVAFAKRILHTAFHHSPAVTSGAIFLVSEVMRSHPGLSSAVLTGEGNMVKYDNTKREPSAAFTSGANETKKDDGDDDDDDDASDTSEESLSANPASLWEISLTTHHYHPSVCKFSSDVGNIQYNGDPLRDFTLAPFLDKFAFRNPKSMQKIKNKFRRGESIGERRSGLEASFKAAKALPVNDPEYWAKQRKVADEDVFFQKFFTERAKRDELKGIDRNKKGDEDEALDAAEGKEINFDWESDEEEEKFVQGLAENLMKSQVHGAKIDYDDEDPDMEDWSDYDDSDEEKEDAGVDEDGIPGADQPLFDNMDGLLMTTGAGDDSDDDDDDDDVDDIEGEEPENDEDEDSDDDMGMEFADDLDIVDDEDEAEDEKQQKKDKKETLSSFASIEDYEELINKNWDQKRKRSESEDVEDVETPTSKKSKKKRKRSKKKSKA